MKEILGNGKFFANHSWRDLATDTGLGNPLSGVQTTYRAGDKKKIKAKHD